MEQIELNFQVREEVGKQAVNRLRREEFIPAVVYGVGEKAMNIKVHKKDVKKIGLYHEGVVINLISEKEKKLVLVKEIQQHPVNSGILHIDFNHISLRQKIKVNVPITIKGEAPGVKEGGVLEHLLWEAEVECLPTNIPEKLEVDVSALSIGDFIYVKDLKPLSGVEIIQDLEMAVISVEAPRKEEEVEEVTEETKGEPELIRKEKEEVTEETKGEKESSAR